MEKILSSTVTPLKGHLKGNRRQVFEITVASYEQPAVLTIMFDVTYKLVSQTENYCLSLKNYIINRDKLDGVFMINESGNYKPVRPLSYHGHNMTYIATPRTPSYKYLRYNY